MQSTSKPPRSSEYCFVRGENKIPGIAGKFEWDDDTTQGVIRRIGVDQLIAEVGVDLPWAEI